MTFSDVVLFYLLLGDSRPSGRVEAESMVVRLIGAYSGFLKS